MKTNIANTKYKIVFDLISTQSYTAIKALIILNDKGLLIKIPRTAKSQTQSNLNQIEMIYSSFRPLYTSNDDGFLINYGLIRACRQIDKQLKLEIFNPSYINTLSIIISYIESVGILLNKTLNSKDVEKLVTFIYTKSQSGAKHLIERFVDFINMLRNEIEIKIIKYVQEDRFYKAIFESKKYYDKSIADLKEHEKLKNTIKKKIMNSHKFIIETNITETLDHNKTQQYNEIRLLNSIMPECEKKVTTSYEHLFSEVKSKASLYIDESIYILLQLINLENNQLKLNKVYKSKVAFQLRNLENDLNAKKLDITELNRGCKSNIDIKLNSENVISRLNKKEEFDKNSNVSTKYSSKKKQDAIQTPKFCPVKEVSEDKIDSNLLNVILAKIEESKEIHSFLPPNCRENIIQNAIEIVHRKFFEISIEEFLSDLFILERDKNNLIKLESMYSYFLHLRNLKNHLFTDENKVHFSNIFFYD
jgi:hypothetical protein